MSHELRATVDEDPKSRDQSNRAVLLDGRYKLDPRPLDEGPRPKSGKSRLNLHGTILEGKINWFEPNLLGKYLFPPVPP